MSYPPHVMALAAWVVTQRLDIAQQRLDIVIDQLSAGLDGKAHEVAREAFVSAVIALNGAVISWKIASGDPGACVTSAAWFVAENRGLVSEAIGQQVV